MINAIMKKTCRSFTRQNLVGKYKEIEEWGSVKLVIKVT